MQAWRADTKAHARVRRQPRASRGTFSHDAMRYLAAVAAMPDLKNRTRHIQEWVREFGARPRDAITAVDIRTIRDRWLTQPRSPGQPPLSAHTVNTKLRALSNLYRVLDGRQAPNPVREVEEAKEHAVPIRVLDYATIERILAAIPHKGRATRIRLEILAYTGLPAKQLMALTADDIDRHARTMRVPGRQKGRGAKPATLPLLPQAVKAFRRLKAIGGFGPFSTSSMHKTWTRACRSLHLTGLRPYDLRHAFASRLFELTQDEHFVMALLQHQSIATSRQYRAAVLQQVWQAKAGTLGQHFGATSLRTPSKP